MKRSVSIAGHRTSVWIEDAFWSGLTEIASSQGKSVAVLVAEIDRGRPADSNLSSAIRVFVFDRFRESQTAPRR